MGKTSASRTEYTTFGFNVRVIAGLGRSGLPELVNDADLKGRIPPRKAAVVVAGVGLTNPRRHFVVLLRRARPRPGRIPGVGSFPLPGWSGVLAW
ncbi:MAG: hypothetical protein V1724_05720 [Chloroflexota bacterium]